MLSVIVKHYNVADKCKTKVESSVECLNMIYTNLLQSIDIEIYS